MIFIAICILYIIGFVSIVFSILAVKKNNDTSLILSPKPIEGGFIQNCHDMGGIVQWDGNDFLMLQCMTKYVGWTNYPGMDGYDPQYPEVWPAKQLADESDELAKKYEAMDPPANNLERFKRYFSIVYPRVPESTWNNYDEDWFVNLWNSLEFYYLFPDSWGATPDQELNVKQNNPFFRASDPDCPASGVDNCSADQDCDKYYGGICDDGKCNYSDSCVYGLAILNQNPVDKPITTAFAEVMHYGDMSYTLTPADLTKQVGAGSFAGTYYYPAKGTGLFLPLGNSLVAYNKIHALVLLGTSNEEILSYAGSNLLYWLDRKGSNKTGTVTNWNGDEISYDPDTLGQIIEGAVNGKDLEEDTDLGQSPYISMGGSTTGGDAMLATLATYQGFDTIQLLQEAQLGKSGIVGYELIDLRVPPNSASQLIRLDPFLINNYAYSAHQNDYGSPSFLVGTVPETVDNTTGSGPDKYQQLKRVADPGTDYPNYGNYPFFKARAADVRAKCDAAGGCDNVDYIPGGLDQTWKYTPYGYDELPNTITSANLPTGKESDQLMWSDL